MMGHQNVSGYYMTGGMKNVWKFGRNAKEAINGNEKKGKVKVMGMVVGNNKTDDSIETQLFFDMMVIC